MFSQFNGNRGFTLVETLIYIAIIGAVSVSFVTFSLSVVGTRNKTYVAQEVQANSRSALGIISRIIKTAVEINTSTSVFDLDPGVLSLNMVSSSLNPTIISLDKDDGVLSVKEGGNSPVNISSNKVKVSKLFFYDLSAGDFGNIAIAMTMEYNNISNDVYYNYTQDIKTAVSLRK